MRFRLVELDSKGEIIKVYYRSSNFFNDRDFNELKNFVVRKYANELNFRDVFSKRRFEIQTTENNRTWEYHSNPIRDYYNLM